MGCRQRLTEKGSTRPGRGVAVREPRANAAADLLSQGPAAAAAGGGGASSVARPLSSSSCVVVRRVSSVVCRRLSLSVVVGCAVVFCRWIASAACFQRAASPSLLGRMVESAMPLLGVENEGKVNACPKLIVATGYT